MDVAYLVASAGLTSYVRTNVRRVDESQQTYRPVLACLFLSFCLLSLSFVETIIMMSVSLSSSSTWWTIILCPNEESETHSQSRRCVRIETAYQVVLWTQVLLMLVVLPSLIGGQIFATIRDDCFAGQQKLDPDEEKKRSFVSPRQYHWSLRLLYRMVRCVPHSTLQLLHYMILLPIAYVADQFTFSQPFRYRQVKTSLPTTHHQSTFAFHDDARLPETSSSLPSGRIHSLRTGAVLGSILGVLSTFALLRILGPLVIRTSPSAPFLSQAVSWLVAVGILLSSCLNGFGSVSMPHSCLAGWYLEPIHDDTIRQARIELQHTQTSLEDRRAELRGNHSTSSPQVPTGLAVTETRQSLWGNRRGSKVFSNIGDEVTQRRKHITTEIAFLETLVAELNEDVEEMQVSQRLAQEARTPLGRVKSWLGIAFSAVLLLRLASAARYLWIHTRSKEDGDSSRGVDLVTQAVVWWTRRDGATTTKSTDVNAAVYSQVISLALTAVLSISQIRTLLRTVAFLHRRWQVFYRKCYCLEGSRPSVNRSSNRPRTDHGHLNLGGSTVLAHAMGMGIGCYFLACVVLTKLMVPESYRRAFAAALGTTEALAVRTYVTQAAFGVAAGGSCLLLGILLSIQRQNVSRYTRNAALHTPTRKSNHAPSLDGAVLFFRTNGIYQYIPAGRIFGTAFLRGVSVTVTFTGKQYSLRVMTSTATTANGSNVPSRWSNVFSLDRHRARYESARVEPDDASTPHSVTPTLTADVVNANDSLTHPLSTPTPASEPSSQLSVASGVDNDADPDDDSVDERDPELGDTRFDVAATVDGLLAPQRSTLTLAELEEERELTRRRAHACSFLAVFVLFKLWMEAFLEEDYGLMLLCLVGTSWTARWIRHMQEREEELDRRIANYLDRSDENGNNTSAPRHDLRMLSFQAQLALAIMESQRQAMEGGYGNSEGANASPGVSEEARATWKRFVYQDVTHNHNHSSAGDHGIPKIFKKDGYGSVSQKEVGSMVEDGPHCSICLGEYEDGEEIVQLPCGHLYHEECIDSWTSNHVKCPLCNLDLEETAAASVNPSNSTSTSVV